MHINSHEELISHLPYIAKSMHTIVSAYITYLWELLHFLLFMCWACTITINFTSPIHNQCDIP